ncbi:DNA repair protein RecO [Ammonifex degensii KC4]|uniref:DNA repair protein RecO n=1 Tax=Ammonifex degensii (strain DSM 10501 / KC4) TaxID=429009 RepID=C9R948_AMMDK|nr:DNA repair protein RecO [Ammonifex degensii]ACX52827.1 DNA repair protein RecO [Ammonifex degensii KC4]
MQWSCAEGVVLRVSPVREADRLLTIFSLERGKLLATAFGGARPRSRKRAATLPFCRARFFLKRRGDNYQVDQAELLERFPGLAHPRLLGYAGYLAEVVEGFSPLEEPNAPLYRLLVSSLRWLRQNPELVAQAFCLKLLRLGGLAPEMTACSSCQRPFSPDWPKAYFSLPGGLLCPSCATGERASLITPGSLRLLRALSELPLGKIFTLKASPASLAETGEVLSSLVTFHLGYRPRSLLYLQSLGSP